MQNEPENHINQGSVSLDQYLLIKKENSDLQAEVLYLKQELAQLKRMIFGSKSERHVGNDPSQLSLGLGADTVEFKEKETEQITYTRGKADKKKRHCHKTCFTITSTPRGAYY